MSLLAGASIVLTSVMNAGSKFWFACRIASLKGLFFESFTCAFVTFVKEIVNCVAPTSRIDFIDEAAPKAEPKGPPLDVAEEVRAINFESRIKQDDTNMD